MAKGDQMHSCAIIWDMDGTIVDTAEMHFQAWTSLAKQRRLPFARADFEATFGRRNVDIVRDMFGAHLTNAEVSEIGDRKEAMYREVVKSGVDLLPGVGQFVQEFNEQCFPQAIGSSAPRANIELIVEIAGIRRSFASIVGAEDTSEGKPHPEVFLKAAENLQMQTENCIVIEDSVAGVQAAKNGGMKCIAVTFCGHHSKQSLIDAGADLVVKSLLELDSQTITAMVE